MNFGEKIKKLRLKKGITQSELAGEEITRNMLSNIENGKAYPSLKTAEHIATRLDVPLSYLFSEEESLFSYKKTLLIDKIKESYRAGNYSEVIKLISTLPGNDDETNYILAYSYFSLGKDSYTSGNLNKASYLLSEAQRFSNKTIYDTLSIDNLSKMYLALCNNIHAPLLDFNLNEFEDSMNESLEIEFYKYIILDYNFPYTNEIYKKHIEIKKKIKTRNYSEAVSELLELDEYRKTQKYNPYFVFSLYTDLENCYRQIMDFENAYRYASKKLTLLEAFKA